MKKGLLMIAALVTFSVAATAQTTPLEDSKTQTLKVELQDVITLSLDNINVPFTFDEANDYLNGVESGEEQLTVHSNKNYNISVKALSANMVDAITSNTIAISGGVVKMKVAAAPTGGTIAGTFSGYTQMPTNSTDIITNATKGQDRTFKVQYLVNPGFTNDAGNYAIDIEYTATQL